MTAVNSNSEHVSLFDLDFGQTDLQVRAVMSKHLLDRLQAIHDESPILELKQMPIERYLNSERVDSESSKKDEKCEELDSVEAATDVADNFKEVKESVSTVVCCDEELERKMSAAQKTGRRKKSDTRKTCQASEHNSPKKDFALHLKLPLCLTHVNVFDPSENLNELGHGAREKNVEIDPGRLKNVRDVLSRTRVTLENPSLDELWSKDAMYFWLKW